MKKLILVSFVAALALFGLVQLVPYGRDHQNPQVVQEPQWNSTQTRQVMQQSCFDCHSNETVWPWYSNIAPISWLIQHDVDEGRRKLNFSEWGKGRQEGDEIWEVVQNGKMPPVYYTILHPEAGLTAAEKEVLVAGLPGTEGRRSGEGEGD
jgi:mono/diheme cytochrome c family protein